MFTNKYVRSKFLAERAIIDSVASNGLNAKIIILGQCPFAQMDNVIKFSPIDKVAKTILMLSEWTQFAFDSA